MSVHNRKPDAEARVRVLIVDDSSMTCWLLQKILDAEPGIDVVGTAANAGEARQLIKQLKPNVITLDVEMPGMSGIDFLRNLMALHPMPVVMVSTLTHKGADVTLEALSLGAVDYISKPKGALSPGQLECYSRELIDKVRVASTARVSALPGPSCVAPVEDHTDTVVHVADLARAAPHHVVAIGASTGGTEAVRKVLDGLPANGPGVLVVQHITGEFNAPFTAKLDSVLRQRVCNAADGQVIEPGCVYVAPADKHLAIKASGDVFQCVLLDTDPVNFHRPSVDVLFESVAAEAGADATGVILTGMGQDGAAGLASIRQAGGHTIAQDEKTSIVWGMPGASVRLGAATETLALDTIAVHVTRRLAKA